MATLAENVARGAAATFAAHPDSEDATTQALDTIVNVAHAGLHRARVEAAAGTASQMVDPGPDGDVTAAMVWFDDVVANARKHFEAEQSGEGS